MMTDKGKEKYSAFLDDEIHQDELMSFSLSSEPEDAKILQRYQIMGDAMRGELSESSFVDVSSAVREALKDEDIVDQVSQTKPVTSPSSKEFSNGWDFSAWFRPAAGVAVAAFVAIVMVVTISDQQPSDSSQVADSNKSQATVMTADVKPSNVEPIAENAKEIQPYINQHLEFATQDTLQGRLPFVRAVSYESKK